MIKQNWFSKGLPVSSIWITDSSYENYSPITQVYGVCFTKEGKVLIVKNLGDWIIPGGTPEPGESVHQTLKREVDEEASVDIGICKMIGCCEVHFPNNPNKLHGEHFYQLRYVALIEKIKELKPDPATGRTFAREFIAPTEFNKYVKWGDVGEEMFRVAYQQFKKWKADWES